MKPTPFFLPAICVVLALGACALSGCASLINGIAPTDCYNATSGSITLLDSSGKVLMSKPAETLNFCPPRIEKVAPAVKAASAV